MRNFPGGFLRERRGYKKLWNGFWKGSWTQIKFLRPLFCFTFSRRIQIFLSKSPFEVIQPIKIQESDFFRYFFWIIHIFVQKDFWRPSWTPIKIWRALFCFTFARRIWIFDQKFIWRWFNLSKWNFSVIFENKSFEKPFFSPYVWLLKAFLIMRSYKNFKSTFLFYFFKKNPNFLLKLRSEFIFSVNKRSSTRKTKIVSLSISQWKQIVPRLHLSRPLSWSTLIDPFR